MEVNRTVGGLLGYSSVNSTVNLNVPVEKDDVIMITNAGFKVCDYR